MANRLCAILTTPLTDPDTGRTGSHVFGAIFDLNAEGKAIDFTPIDFDGRFIRDWQPRYVGKPTNPEPHHAGATSALFFPITASSAQQLTEGMETLREQIARDENPFYRAGVCNEGRIALKTALERPGRAAVNFLGQQHTNASPPIPPIMLQYTRPRAPTNCRSFLFDLMQHVGGIPLPAGLATLPLTTSVEKAICRLTNSGGTLIHTQDGRLCYAANFGVHGTGSILSALNDLQHQNTDGTSVPLAQFLLMHSAPFYDPAMLEQSALPLRTR